MNLDELQAVRDRERKTDKLQELRESFYADAGEFIQELREQRERAAERADDPFDAPEVNRLSDEIDTAEGTVEAIYEKRVGKIVKAASIAAADLPAGSEGMTAEEQDLFETLVADIKANRQHVLDVLAGEDTANAAGEATADPAPPTEATDDSTDTSLGAADVMGGAGAETASASDPDAASTGVDATAGDGSDRPVRRDGDATEAGRGADTAREAHDADGESATGSAGGDADTADHERETVRITDDVGTILGVDEREYDLSKDDVVRLPTTNADPLVERDAAERVD